MSDARGRSGPHPQPGGAATEVSSAAFELLMAAFVEQLVSRAAASRTTPQLTRFLLQLDKCEDTRAGREALYRKLDRCGYEVGRRLVERLTRDRQRLGSVLEVVKFICRDLWGTAFGKTVDKLQTNHRGMYVLQDRAFKWLARHSAATDEDTRELARRALFFPCGLIRGALIGLGVEAVVQAELGDTFPHCTLNILYAAPHVSLTQNDRTQAPSTSA